MARLLLALIGVVLLAVVALGLVWLLGQLLVGMGAFVVATVGVLSRLLWYVVFTGLLAGLVYFIASAWRPARRPAGGPVRLDDAASVPAQTVPGTPNKSTP